MKTIIIKLFQATLAAILFSFPMILYFWNMKP